MDLIFNDWYDLNRVFAERNSYKDYPGLNVYENNDEYNVVIKTPGMKKKDIEISFKDNTLKIRGERKKGEEEKSTSHLLERFSGKFERNILLPEKVDPEKIAAEFKSGLLIIKLGKSDDTKPRVININ
jgi:HSP20 family protein